MSQPNTRRKALDEIYQSYIPLHLSDLEKSATDVDDFSYNVSRQCRQLFAIFVAITAETRVLLDHQET